MFEGQKNPNRNLENPAQAGLEAVLFFFFLSFFPLDARGRANMMGSGSQKSRMHGIKNLKKTMWRQKAKEFRNSKQKLLSLDHASNQYGTVQ